MRYRWVVGLLVVVGCSANYATAPTFEPNSDAGKPAKDAGDETDGGSGGDGDSGTGSSNDAGNVGADAGVDAGPQIPFASYLVLRVETDAPNGLQVSGAWRDLSPLAQTISVAGGTPTYQSTGDAGAKAMIFDSTLFLDVADAPSLRFGTTDDFMVVARATEGVPLEPGSGCTFHYLFTKYNADGATGTHIRVCAPNTGATLVGSVKLVSNDATVVPPGALQSQYGVISFARNVSGTRIETYAGGASFENTIPLIDVSSMGSALVLGGARANGTGGVFGGYIGKVNRLYVYHAPGGTFSKADLDAIRSYVQGAAPLP